MISRAGVVSLLGVVLFAAVVFAVDRSKFRTCSQTAFCRRLRGTDANNHQNYVVKPGSVAVKEDGDHFTAQLVNSKYPLQPELNVKLQLLSSGAVRLKINEQSPLHPRHEVQDVTQSAGLIPVNSVSWAVTEEAAIGTFKSVEVTVDNTPFRVRVKVDGLESMVVNSENLLAFEVYRAKNPKPQPPAEGAEAAPEASEPNLKFPYDEDGMWEESFGGHTDSKPRGPSGVGLDVTFVGSEHVYGLPEHATSFARKNTRGEGSGYSEPYRLYNLDVFEYELDNPMALYGAVPLLLSHDGAKTTGALWLNAAETFVDVYESKDAAGIPRKHVHWMSESGVIDLYLFPGPQPGAFFRQYAELTGYPALPQRFATGYHQCRWNYRDEDDVKSVDGGFDEHDIPYDVLWLDIEHTDGKRYFTWDKTLFPDPKRMQDSLAAKGRKMVTIVDPHIKRDSGYKVHSHASNNGLYVMNSPAKGGVYEGWCWPGSVSYLDFTSSLVREYWASQFAYSAYDGSTANLYTWNDMNEPSVFNGPEVTMPKDCTHAGGVEHRDVHNQYGFYTQMATYQGHAQRDHQRPFVLTRSFFAGSQRYGAVWTGDNKADWESLAIAQPMLLSLNVAGIVFSGADVGGFFSNPDAELLVRWYQAAAFQPFFRGHSHIDSKRREPWVMGEPHTAHIRSAIRQRYRLLPYVYTQFFNASVSGMPIMRPLWVEFPRDHETFGIEDQFLLGPSLMVTPVTKPGVTSVQTYLPGQQPWYNWHTGARYKGEQTIIAEAPADRIPVMLRGGSVVPTRERWRRSSSLMEKDPFTLLVALDNEGSASGDLYLDDGNTFDYVQGHFAHRVFTFRNHVLRASASPQSGIPLSARPVTFPQNSQTTSGGVSGLLSSLLGSPKEKKQEDSEGQQKKEIAALAVTIEKIVLWGAPASYQSATLVLPDGVQQVLSLGKAADGSLVVRKPSVHVAGTFEIHFA